MFGSRLITCDGSRGGPASAAGIGPGRGGRLPFTAENVRGLARHYFSQPRWPASRM